MFGLRWITATSLTRHTSPRCPVLKAQRTRSGWLPFLVPRNYGAPMYRDCRRCQ